MQDKACRVEMIDSMNKSQLSQYNKNNNFRVEKRYELNGKWIRYSTEEYRTPIKNKIIPTSERPNILKGLHSIDGVYQMPVVLGKSNVLDK